MMSTLLDPSPGNSRLYKVCLRLLCDAQNSDGGWGGRMGAHSAVEPTAWALIALSVGQQDQESQARSERAKAWLLSTQLADGSWPASPRQSKGCWVTAPAAWALSLHPGTSEQWTRSTDWFCRELPREGSRWWRFKRWWSGGHPSVTQNLALVGWSWTPGTSSWVEPTAYTLLFLQATGIADQPSIAKRVRNAEAMLRDRMCPGGGWNCGNPSVYGVAGQPQILTTAWALLALRQHPDHPVNQQSLAWLEKNWQKARGPASLAITRLCLSAYRRDVSGIELLLLECFETNQFLDSVYTTAWCALALHHEADWLR